MADARIDVVIGSQQAQSGARAVTRAVEDIKGSFLELSAKVFVAQQALAKVWDLAGRGATFEETMGRLNRQMGAFHGTAQQMVADLEAISNQTLSIDKAASIASRGLATGLNPDQIKLFTQAADALDDVLGTDLPTAFDQIVQAAITGRSQILANIGVYIDLDEEIKKLAVSTNRTTEQITKQEKVMLTANAVTAQAGDALKKLSDGALSDADRLKQVEKRWSDLWTAIGQGAKNTTLSILDFFDDLGKRMEAFAKEQEERQKKSQGKVITPFGRGGFEPSDHDPRIFGPTFHDYIVGRSREEAQKEHDEITRRTHEANYGVSSERFQSILGQAIAQQAGANFTPPQPKFEPARSLQAAKLDAERDRREKGLQADFDRTKARLDATSQLYDLDAQRQILSQEDVVTFKTTMRQQELAKQGEFFSKQLVMEKELHDRRVKIGFDTTDDKIEEDERYRSKVFDINQQIAANVQASQAAQDQSEAERDIARMAAEDARGRRLQDQLNAEYRMREDLRQRDFEDEQARIQSEIELGDALFQGEQSRAQRERELLRAQLAFKLRLSEDDVKRAMFLENYASTRSPDQESVDSVLSRGDSTLSLQARRNLLVSAVAKDVELAEQANGDFVAGWMRGLQKYASNTESVFGMAQDMARRTAQTMEQGFQRFFFDGMEGKFQSFKDVLQGVLDFTKQIVSQMAAQLVTVGLVKPGVGALMGFFGGNDSAGAKSSAPSSSGGYPIDYDRFGGIERFSLGGITSSPKRMSFGGRMVEFGEGAQSEAFVPLPDGRTIPVTMRYAGNRPMPVAQGGMAVSVPIDIQIINQVSGARVETQRQTSADGRQQIRIMIREEMKSAFASGDMDLAQSRFGNKPQPYKR